MLMQRSVEIRPVITKLTTFSRTLISVSHLKMDADPGALRRVDFAQPSRIKATLAWDYVRLPLILLCHKLARWQQGQRGKRLAMLRASLMRMVAIDALMWRSARIGGSAWSVTRG